MASFDFDSAMAGAQTGGATGNPYAALAGFVLSGFIGGKKKSAMKKLMKKKEKRLKKLSSPQHLAETVSKLTPMFRQQVAGGAGAEATQAITSSVARRGLGGTGIGTALIGGAAAIPEIMAFKQALGQGQDVVDREIAATAGQRVDEPRGYADEIGQIGDAVAMFKALGEPNGMGGLNLLAPGEFDRREGAAAANATQDFGNQDFDFSKFQYRR